MHLIQNKTSSADEGVKENKCVKINDDVFDMAIPKEETKADEIRSATDTTEEEKTKKGFFAEKIRKGSYLLHTYSHRTLLAIRSTLYMASTMTRIH